MEWTAREVKELAVDLGAHLCGIAPAERFVGAPVGAHPKEALESCRSVIVVAKRFLRSTAACRSAIPYTVVRNDLSDRLDELTVWLADRIEETGGLALPVGAVGPCNWDEAAKRMRGLISLKHAAERAGLGRIGRNTLLVNERFGNMIWLGAVLTDLELEGDPLVEREPCPKGCSLCVQACPVHALDGELMNQSECWNRAFELEEGGTLRINCFECRRVCPNASKWVGSHAERQS